MWRRFRVLLIPLLGVLWLPGAMAAELRTVELGAFGGAFFGDSSAGVDNSVIWGARFGVAFTPSQQLEFVYDRVDTTFQGPTLGALDEVLTSFAAQWVFNFPNRRGPFIPYVLVGIGQIKDEVKGVPDPQDSSAPRVDVDDDATFFPFAGGFRAVNDKGVGVRVEVRFKSYSTFDVGQTTWDTTVGLTALVGKKR